MTATWCLARQRADAAAPVPVALDAAPWPPPWWRALGGIGWAVDVVDPAAVALVRGAVWPNLTHLPTLDRVRGLGGRVYPSAHAWAALAPTPEPPWTPAAPTGGELVPRAVAYVASAPASAPGSAPWPDDVPVDVLALAPTPTTARWPRARRVNTLGWGDATPAAVRATLGSAAGRPPPTIRTAAVPPWSTPAAAPEVWEHPDAWPDAPAWVTCWGVMHPELVSALRALPPGRVPRGSYTPAAGDAWWCPVVLVRVP